MLDFATVRVSRAEVAMLLLDIEMMAARFHRRKNDQKEPTPRTEAEA